jgi:hypothetical protein
MRYSIMFGLMITLAAEGRMDMQHIHVKKIGWFVICKYAQWIISMSSITAVRTSIARLQNRYSVSSFLARVGYL